MIDNELRDLFDKASYAHLWWVMDNKGEFLKSHNISTVQYMNSRQYVDSYKFNALVFKAIVRLVAKKAKTLLNIGTAAGLLELVNKRNDSPLIMSSVEWDEQYRCCEKVRHIFDVDVQYQCNDIYEDDFKIFDCQVYYDYLILERFFPLYHTKDSCQIDEILSKLAPYGREAVVVESDKNWSRKQRKYIRSISTKQINISNDWNMFVINLEKRYKDEAYRRIQ